MRNPFTARRRRFVAATMAAAEARVESLAEAIAVGWIEDANSRVDTFKAELAQARADLEEARTRLGRREFAQQLANDLAARLAEAQRANEAMHVPIGIDPQWVDALEDARTRILAEAALARTGDKVS
ncbi:hypothetical protein [Embleya sp. NPDC005971]|uniref:hypothetical protein n=1 Tax=Embleya sp. NPDC005971 TaxID=3156724 RepID=UPI0033F4106F